MAAKKEVVNQDINININNNNNNNNTNENEEENETYYSLHELFENQYMKLLNDEFSRL
jgi:hypothetical protein